MKTEGRDQRAEVGSQPADEQVIGTYVTVRYYGGAYIARARAWGKTCSCTMTPMHAVQGLAKKLAGCPDVRNFGDTGIEVRSIAEGVYVVKWKPAEIRYAIELQAKEELDQRVNARTAERVSRNRRFGGQMRKGGAL